MGGLIPDEGVCLWHGQPRDFKTLCAQETALAMASGRTPFGNERFVVRRPVKCAYFTEEDSERLYATRMKWLMAGSDAPPPGTFFPFVRRGLAFDTDQKAILAFLSQCGAEVAFFDPLRSFTANADKGPADLAPVSKFIRRIQNETACQDRGDRPPRHETGGRSAEGGCAVSVSTGKRRRRLLDLGLPCGTQEGRLEQGGMYPEDYKVSGDPTPFEVTFETDEHTNESGAPCFGSWVRPVAVTKDEHDLGADANQERVEAFLRRRNGDGSLPKR